MSYGINTTNLANVLLNALSGSSFVAPAVWAQLHVGDPSAAATANRSANTTRQQLTFAAAASGSMALASTPAPWNMTATETIAAISLWSAATSGVPYWTIPLTSSQAVNSGDTFTLLTCVLGLAPLAV